MVEILRNKNQATKFQILAEMANGGPHIQQKKIADNLGITPQAVSEYIKQLLQEGFLSLENHSRYRLSVEGVNWIIRELRSLKEYSDFVVKSISVISECAAIAQCDLEDEQTVGLIMKDGLLWATGDTNCEATGITCGPARTGDDVGIRYIQGIVSLKPGKVTLLTIPPVQKGGSRQVDLESLKIKAANRKPVCALGIEALVALQKAHTSEIAFFGAIAIAIEAAQHGLNPLVVCVENETGSLIKKLDAAGVEYSVTEIPASAEP